MAKPIIYDEQHVKLTRMFLANCVRENGSPDIRPKLLMMDESILVPKPEELNFWRVLNWYWEKGYQPAKTDILSALEAYPTTKGRSETIWSEIMKEQTADMNPQSVLFRLMFFHEQDSVMKAAKKNLDIAQNPGRLTTFEVIQQMMDNIYHVNPALMRVTELDANSQGVEIMDEIQNKKYERWLRGVVSSPRLPFEGLRRFIPALTEGDPVLWTMQTKYGKSITAQIIAEHASEYCYVVSVENETSVAAYEQRRMARHLGVPMFAFKSDFQIEDTVYPMISRKAPEWAELYKRYDQYLGLQQKNEGRFVRINGADLPLPVISARVGKHKLIADSLGLDFLLIVDYLQATGREGLDANTEREALAEIATGYKHLIQNLNAYGVVFAQETINDQGMPTAFGSSEAQKRFQIHISTQRTVAKESDAVMLAGEHLTNAFGLKRFYHKAGKLDSNATIKVLLANGDDTGECKVRYENALLRITDAEELPVKFDQLIF